MVHIMGHADVQMPLVSSLLCQALVGYYSPMPFFITSSIHSFFMGKRKKQYHEYPRIVIYLENELLKTADSEMLFSTIIVI